MKDLITLIDKFIIGKINRKEFDDKFNDLYLTEDSNFEEAEENFLSEIHYQLAYVTENPDEIDRKDGFISADEFREWLKDYKQKNIHFWKK